MSLDTARSAVDADTSASDTITVRLFAGARAATGRRELTLAAPVGGTVSDLLNRLVGRHPGIADVLPACSFLLDGVRARSDSQIGQATTLDVLPPFSGG